MSETEDYKIQSSRSLGVIPHDDDRNRDLLEQACEHWWALMEADKWSRAVSWFTNHCFLVGNQYPGFIYSDGSIRLDPATHAISTNALARVPKVADNRLTRPYDANISLLTQLKPYPRVTPNSAAPEDEDAASLSEVVHGVLWERPLRMPEKMRQVAADICLNGTSALEITYTETDTPTEIPETKKVEQPDELLGGTTTKIVETGKMVTVPRKDIQARVFNAFQLTVDPTATDDLDSLKWICRTTYEDIDWIKENFDRNDPGFFPDNLDKISEDCAPESPLYYSEMLKNVLDNPSEVRSFLSAAPGNVQGAPAPNMTAFKLFDVRPTMQFPKGRTLVLAGGKLIYAAQARAWSERYPWRWHPYAIARYGNIRGRFWGKPLLSDLVPLQRRINAIDSLVQLNREFMVIGQLLIPKSCKIPDGAMTGVPGVNIRYTDVGGNEPKPVPRAPLPAELLAEREILVQAIEEISGTNKILEGQNPANVRSGLQLDFLKRELMASKNNLLSNFEQFLETVSQNILCEVSNNFEEDDSELTNRIKVAARDFSNAAVQNFTGVNLRDNVYVRIDLTSELTRSPEAKADRAMSFLQYTGANMTPQERAIVARAMGIDDFDKQINPQVQKVKRMISRIVNGMPEAAQLVMPGIDDPAIFADVIRTELLSDRFIDHDEETKRTLFSLYYVYQDMLQARLEAAQAMIPQANAPQEQEGAVGTPNPPSE